MPGAADSRVQARARCDAALRRCFPAHHGAIERGWELADRLADGAGSFTDDVLRRFLHREVAIIGDSAGTVRFHLRDADLIGDRVYFRIGIYPSDPPAHPQCVHYEACAFGVVHAILPEFRQVALLVSTECYLIIQTY